MFYPHSHHSNPNNNSPYFTKMLDYQKGISLDLHVSHDRYIHDNLFCHCEQRMYFKLFYFILKEILKLTKNWTQGQWKTLMSQACCISNICQAEGHSKNYILKRKKYILNRVIHRRINCAPIAPASQWLWYS